MRALVDGIRAGVAPPGTRLPRDRELATRFGVSRPVVREAIDLLRRAGIVEVRRGNRGGVFVRSLAIPTELLTGRTRLGLEEIRHPRITKRNAEVVKVVLDNGEEVVCTPDHRFMLRDGSYERADSLASGMSLMPLYRKLSDAAEPGT